MDRYPWTFCYTKVLSTSTHSTTPLFMCSSFFQNGPHVYCNSNLCRRETSASVGRGLRHVSARIGRSQSPCYGVSRSMSLASDNFKVNELASKPRWQRGIGTVPAIWAELRNIQSSQYRDHARLAKAHSVRTLGPFCLRKTCVLPRLLWNV